MAKRVHRDTASDFSEDSLQCILLHVKRYTDIASLQQTCKHIRGCVLRLGLVSILEPLEKACNVRFKQEVRLLLTRHILIALKMHTVTRSSDAFIQEFERCKCTVIQSRFYPCDARLAKSICPYVHNFRYIGPHLLIGRMTKKLINDAQHDAKGLCGGADTIEYLVVMYAIHCLYCWNKLMTINMKTIEANPNMGPHFCVGVMMNVSQWLDLQHKWVPVLDSESCMGYTDLDTDQIRSYINKIKVFRNAFKYCMNVSSLYKYRGYRRDLSFSKGLLTSINNSLEQFHV